MNAYVAGPPSGIIKRTVSDVAKGGIGLNVPVTGHSTLLSVPTP